MTDVVGRHFFLVAYSISLTESCAAGLLCFAVVWTVESMQMAFVLVFSYNMLHKGV